jgi:3-methyladenine DNA glycosylase AlkD
MSAAWSVAGVIAELEAKASATFRDDMGSRYGIVTNDRTLGVSMANMKALAKRIGRDHKLAQALWKAGVYEARIMAVLVDDADAVTAAQMDRWRRDFDNWSVTDTACFALFDRSPHAFDMVGKWAKLNDEFGKRAAFALLACLAIHGRGEDAFFLGGLKLVEAHAGDERNFVKKGVSWALRGIGGKKSPVLRKAAREVAARLAASDDKTERWVGKDAMRAFAKPTTRQAG